MGEREPPSVNYKNNRSTREGGQGDHICQQDGQIQYEEGTVGATFFQQGGEIHLERTGEGGQPLL